MEGFLRLVGDTERRLTFNASDDETDDDSYNGGGLTLM
jgi:hypothetical protein